MIARDQLSLLSGLGIVIVGSLLLEISRLNTWDEAWFLHAMTRTAQGEVLYRDVFYPTTPLAAYVGAGLVAAFGSELVVLKLTGIACIAATFVLLLWIADQLHLRLAPAAFGAVVLLVELPYTFGYTILATTLMVSSLAALLAWQARTASTATLALTWLVLTGTLAGACLATKHNVGAYVAAALTISVPLLLYSTARRTARDTFIAIAALVAPMGIVPLALMIPVLLSGAQPAAFDILVAAKLDYVKYSATAVSYSTGFSLSLGALLPDDRVSVRTLLEGLHGGRPWVYLLPPATALAAAWAWWRRPEVFGGAGLPVVLFAAAAAASIFPLAEQSHFTVVAPIFLVAIAYLAGRTVPRAVSSWSAVACVALGGMLMATAPLLWLRTDSRVAITRHLRGVVLPPGAEAQLIDRAREIRVATGGEETFLLFPEAGLHYLIGDIANPTPYDFPLRGSFGTHGMDIVLEQARHGEVRYVCVDPSWGLPGPPPGPFPALVPSELSAAIRERLTPVATLAACDLYRSDTPEAGG